MAERLNDARVLIYSHDSFGLGHLRRCQAIAHSLVEHYKGLSIIILSGSPIIGSFNFRARVDFVRVPGVIKLYNGDYTSLGLHIDLKQTLAIRASIIRHTADVFSPDVFLVDKEPLGLREEITETLTMLKARGTRLILGLRDVMDEPMMLKREWEARRMISAVDGLYDDIWVYGHEEFWNPLSDIDVPQSIRDRMTYTGFLPRELPTQVKPQPVGIKRPYILIAAGGGGDGFAMMDWVLRAYEAEPDLPYAPLFLFGPFMESEERRQLMNRVNAITDAKAVDFDNAAEWYMEKAAGVIAMGGYNTFCEILSLDKRAIIVPRRVPRMEQFVRAREAERLGLVRMLVPGEMPGDLAPETSDPAVMADAIRHMADQPLPSEGLLPGMLDGLSSVCDLVRPHLSRVDAAWAAGPAE